jgi:pantoate--beta-alanine ligase
MLEIEQKYARPNFDTIEKQLRAWGAAGPEVHDEADHYFNAPDRDFARTGEAFRLRRIGPHNYFTYKGPKRQAAVKIRTELEIPLPDGDDAAQQHIELLGHLGYRAVAVIRKRRASWSLKREGLSVTVCLDEAEGLGRFAEVEVLAPEEPELRGLTPPARHSAAEVLQRLAAELALSEVEPRSYLTMYLQSHAAAGRRAPVVVTTIPELRQALAEARRQHLTVGLVPTMGALHAGHRSLIKAARARNDFLVVSIFVNPTQFGPREDLARYPRPFEDDVRQCAEEGVDLIFHPEPATMYPPGFRTWVEVTGLQDVLEGASRPGHFRGVATVVLKLFNQVRPDRAYFGQKDAQQARIIQQMARDLDVPIEIVICPIIREPAGLALSSRNRYLEPDQRRQAVVLHQALQEARQSFLAGERSAARLAAVLRSRIESAPGATLDYAAVVDADTFGPIDTIDRAALLALAVRFGSTRLIDNLDIK